MRILGILIALCMLYPSPSSGAGYTPRPCGLDMNRNGIIGEPADCNVCNGVTLDPDGDGVNEDQIYVDSNTGNDTTGNGSPGNPYKTITKPLSVADGPSDGAEDIICISGIFHESLTLTQSGVSSVTNGFYIRDGFQFPNNPMMIIGWDKDGDGQYPPFDKDDTAVLDGQTIRALAIADAGKGFLELAHFTVKNYGTGAGNSGFIDLGSGGAVTHDYFHDLELIAINQGVASLSNSIVYNFFGRQQHIAIINTSTNGFGSYWVRGSSDNNGPYRFSNNTLKMHGCDDAVCGSKAAAAAVKLWDENTGVEILNNVIDANVAVWTPRAFSGSPTYGISVAQCSQDWTIRGNTFVDLKIAINVQPFASGFCASRTTHNIVIDRNIIRNTYAPWQFGDLGISIEQGNSTTATAKDITITNNFLSSSVGWESCIWSRAGNPAGTQPGTITIAGNTCYGTINRYAALVIGNVAGAEEAFPQMNYVIKNNIFAATGSNVKVNTEYVVTNWIANGNVYGGTGNYVWNNVSHATLASWRAASGQDPKATECDPSFVDPANGNLHLLTSDTCAKNAGVDISSITMVDIDGDRRSLSNPASGADEILLFSPPMAPTNLTLQ